MTRTAILIAALWSMPMTASADLIMTIGAEGHGQASSASGAFTADTIHGFSNPFSSVVTIGGLPCGDCVDAALYTGESLGEIDGTGHVRMVANAEPTPANPAQASAYVQAILTDRLLVTGPVTFDIEIDTSLFSLGGGFGQSTYSFTLSGGMSGFSFSAYREYDMVTGSFASWSATTVDGGNPQAGAPGFLHTSVTLVPLPFESFIDLVLDVQGAANCIGLGCNSFMSSLGSGCLRATGDFVSTSGYSFDCDISDSAPPTPVPEPAAASLLLVAGVAAARRWRAAARQRHARERTRG